MADEKNKPAKKFGPVWTGAGYVEVAVWANAGENRTKHSVTTRRTYKSNDTWKETQSLFEPDLLPLSRLLEQAWAWITAQSGRRESAD